LAVSLRKWRENPPFHTPSADHFLVGKPMGLLGKPTILANHPYEGEIIQMEIVLEFFPGKLHGAHLK